MNPQAGRAPYRRGEARPNPSQADRARDWRSRKRWLVMLATNPRATIPFVWGLDAEGSKRREGMLAALAVDGPHRMPPREEEKGRMLQI